MANSIYYIMRTACLGHTSKTGKALLCSQPHPRVSSCTHRALLQPSGSHAASAETPRRTPRGLWIWCQGFADIPEPSVTGVQQASGAHISAAPKPVTCHYLPLPHFSLLRGASSTSLSPPQVMGGHLPNTPHHMGLGGVSSALEHLFSGLKHKSFKNPLVEAFSRRGSCI